MRSVIIFAAAAFLVAPAPLVARTAPLEVAAATVGVAQDPDKDAGNSRLGLLGLMGLAGLLGLFRREPNIHVDARRDPQR